MKDPHIWHHDTRGTGPMTIDYWADPRYHVVNGASAKD